MITGLTLVLLITVVGMGLVFLSIIFLWAIMELLVRITPYAKFDSTKATTITATGTLPSDSSHPIEYIVAVAAVSVALAEQADHSRPHVFPLPPTALVSAWQAVMRTRMLSKRGSIR